MTWLRQGSLVALAVLGAATTTVTAVAQVLVIRSSGPSAGQYPAGRKLPAGASVTLASGDSVVLLDKQGTRTLSGPGSFPATAAAATEVAANSGVAALMSARRITHARTGAVRGVGEPAVPARSPNIWYVDLTRGQTACEPDLGAVRLWRPDIAAAVSYRVIPAGGGAGTAVSFDAGQAAAAWPAAMPIGDGASFTIVGDGLPAPVRLRFVKVDAPPVDAEALATTLVAHGCQAQLDLLVATLSPASEGTASQ